VRPAQIGEPARAARRAGAAARLGLTPVHVIGSFAFALVVMIPLWRICQRAGLPAALALIALVPYVGIIVVVAVLAFSRWTGVRSADRFGPYQPDLFDGKSR